ncbi:hypothetical protein SDC9_85416 [bioreactor metagenome]|uniref:Uncharacterized protein n=1 Tax=bioreactor metagenome TaxID=1076179 RepID=A0A644ZD48_9ZZZZ
MSPALAGLILWDPVFSIAAMAMPELPVRLRRLDQCLGLHIQRLRDVLDIGQRHIPARSLHC